MSIRFLLLCTAIACASVARSQDDHGSLTRRLAEARDNWQRAAIADYVYGYNKFCECHAETPPETLVSVAAGIVTDVRHRMVKTGDVVPAASDNFALYWTVDDLFGLIERAAGGTATVQADFDAQNGVPQRIFIDYLPDIIGDEVDVRVTSFSAD
jgi:hypothetical protein